MTESRPVLCTARPSLALVKYWGKDVSSPDEPNIPATTSIAVTLAEIESRTEAGLIAADDSPRFPDDRAGRLSVNGIEQVSEDIDRYFAALRRTVAAAARHAPELFLPEAASDGFRFSAESVNTFPTASGLASSSSGFAALTGACVAACIRPEFRAAWVDALAEQERSLAETTAAGGWPAAAIPESKESGSPLPALSLLSSLSRIGSGSAARSVYGGFTVLPAGARAALPVAGAAFWPDLRILIVRLSDRKKPISSRQAMELTRKTSPYYEAWTADAVRTADAAYAALRSKDAAALGPLVRNSYLRMFATMFAADPPVVYWLPESLAVIRVCGELRDSGISAWETMDAGPQVKILTLAAQADAVRTAVLRRVPEAAVTLCTPGRGLDFPEISGTPR